MGQKEGVRMRLLCCRAEAVWLYDHVEGVYGAYRGSLRGCCVAEWRPCVSIIMWRGSLLHTSGVRMRLLCCRAEAVWLYDHVEGVYGAY